jgi:hypothetical protein
MKFAAVFLLAFIAAATAAPTKISENNVGDIVNVGISAKAKLSNEVDQTIVNVILGYLNNQKIKVGRSGSDVEAPGSPFPDITPEMIEQMLVEHH